MRDGVPAGGVGGGRGVSRSLPVTGRGAGCWRCRAGRVRVLMVISRPAWDGADVGDTRMVARPLLERSAGLVRGEVDLTVLRPPTFQARCARR